MRTRSGGWLAALAALALTPVVAWAQPQAVEPAVAPAVAPASDPSIGMAQAAIDQASDRFRAGDFALALEALTTAEPLAAASNQPALAAIRFNISRCLEELKRHREAIAAYERYLLMPDEPHRKKRAVVAIAALEERAYGRLSVSCLPREARLAITGLEGRQVSCPFDSRRVEPGPHRVSVSAIGFAPQARDVLVELGKTAHLDAVLVPIAPEASTPVALGPERPLWPFAVLSLGVAALGGGAYLMGSAAEHRDDAEGRPPGSARSAVIDTYETRETLSIVSFGVGLIALTIGGLGLAMEPSE